MIIFKERRFTASVIGHYMVDVLNGQRVVVFTYLAVTLGLSNAFLGLISSLYAIFGGIAQPFFGYLTDRFGARLLATGGILWMAFFYSIALMIPGPLALVFLILASIGSGAFHPAGAMQATLIGRVYLSGRVATTASLFFLFGQSGYFTGPLISGALVNTWGLKSLLIITAIAVLVGVFTSFALRNALKSDKGTQTKQQAQSTGSSQFNFWPFLLLIVVAGLQSWTQQNINTFFPKYLSDLGKNPAAYGLITSLFMAGSAIGNVLGGNLADRIKKQKVIFFSLSLSSIPLFLLPLTGITIWVYPVILLSGFLTGASFSILVVLGQQVFPGKEGLASGLVLGFLYSSGALGTLLTGSIADRFGLVPVFFLSAILALVAGLLSPLLEDKSSLPTPQTKAIK